MEIEILTIRIGDKVYRLQEIRKSTPENVLDPEVLSCEQPRNYKFPDKQRYGRRKPKGAIGRDKVYSRWIMKDELQKVIQAMNKVELGYVPDTFSIASEVKMKVDSVRAILHYMKVNGLAKSKRQVSGKCVWRSASDTSS